MSQFPFLVGGAGLNIGTNASPSSGNILLDNTTGNLFIGNSINNTGNLIINGNTTGAGMYAANITGGMGILGNLYVNGYAGIHASYVDYTTIGISDIFYCLVNSIGGAGLPAGTIITQSGGSPITVANGAGIAASPPDGTYKVVGCFQSVQSRGLVVRLS